MLFRSLCLAFALALPLPAHAAEYLVRPGDTLGAIAKSHGVSIRAMAQANGITNVNLIRIGRYLIIPTRTRVFWYHVRWGDTLIELGRHNGIRVSTIRSLNRSLGAYPLAGQWLRLCSGCLGTGEQEEVQVSPGEAGTEGTAVRNYIVRPGDNLTSIAGRFGVTASAVMSINRLIDKDLIVIGSRLRIPGLSGGSSWQAVYDPWTSRALIIQFAGIYGVESALPLAIGWQESGFNENMISPTAAVGVMQVEPYTGDRISRLLGRHMDLYNVRDNVQAGVFWIANLLRYYGGDERLAIAAYYQGTRSLAHHGFYQDTYQYVANVLALKSRFGG